MSKRSPQISSVDSQSSIERLYLSKLHNARYAYESRYGRSDESLNRLDRHISVLDIDQFIRLFSLKEYASRYGHTLYYEHSHLTLPVGSYVAFEMYQPDHAQLGELYLHSTTGQSTTYTQVLREDISSYIGDHFDCTDQFSPRMAVTYRARLMCGQVPDTQQSAWCIIEDQVMYREPKEQLTLASETHSRVYWLSKPVMLETIKFLPLSTRYWMGEYHYKRLHRFPCYNELEGYEYEAKLTPTTLNIDEHRLPYGVIERYQTESIRWYLPKNQGRIGFREGRASLVKKGKKVILNGIIKRSEEKSQGLSMWDISHPLSKTEQIGDVIPDDRLEMRRVKRQLYLLHPKSYRVYALCLDDCRAESRLPFRQIEVEYNGKLCLPIDQLIDAGWLSFKTQAAAAKKLSTLHPKAALRCAERALLLAPQTMPLPSTTQQTEVHTLLEHMQQSLSTVIPKDITHKMFKQIEQEVLNEMRIILEYLVRQEGCETSVQTKRSWLKGDPVTKTKSQKYTMNSNQE